MSREKIINTKTNSKAAINLKAALLNYHDFQLNNPPSKDNQNHKLKLAEWQSQRLKHSHNDFYASPAYQNGLNFLFTDLYSTEDFSQRDQDLERIFPKMVKYLPNAILDTVSLLIELNLLTQQLDSLLAQTIFDDLEYPSINESSYCEAYRSCNNKNSRLKQIQLTSELGRKLDKYARSSVIKFTLKITESPAEMAGLGALHHFLCQGFTAFHHMPAVNELMQAITDRELKTLDAIYDGQTSPFNFTLNL